MADETILVERDGPLLIVTLNRPDVLNALDSAAHFVLDAVWQDFEADDSLWVAILTGSGERAFCVGNDLKATARGDAMAAPPSGFGGLTNRPHRTKPVIAAVNGMAMGGGFEIVLACDLAIAADNARFALPEVKVGLYAAAGGVERLTQHIGRKQAMELILSGRAIGTAEALALGLVNAAVPATQVMDTARAMATTLLANSPLSIRASKAAINALDESGSLDAALSGSMARLTTLLATDDAREGIAAFAEKRAPVWQGH